MAASLTETAQASLRAAYAARTELHAAQAEHHTAYLRYIRDAMAAGWPLSRIGYELGVTARAIRWYWNEHRQQAGRIQDATTQATGAAIAE